MSMWGSMYDRGSGKEIRKEDWLYVDFDAALNYTEQVKEYIKKTIHDLHFNPIIFPLKKSAEIGKHVFISAERKTYQILFKERFPEIGHDWDKLANVLVLGEYKRDEKEIVLYINNIKEIKHHYGDLLPMMRFVYLHELMHAFFERTPGHKYIYEIEEAFAEFGALKCLAELVDKDKADPAELDWALSHVNGKKGALQCYSYGYDLYHRYKETNDLSKTILESYL